MGVVWCCCKELNAKHVRMGFDWEDLCFIVQVMNTFGCKAASDCSEYSISSSLQIC